MSTTNETLSYRIHIERTGETAAQLQKLRTELMEIGKLGTNATNASGLGNLFNNLNTSIKSLSTSVDSLSNRLKGLNTSANLPNVKKISNDMRQTTLSTEGAIVSMKKYDTGLRQTNTTMGQTSTTTKQLKASMDGLNISQQAVATRQTTLTGVLKQNSAAFAENVSRVQQHGAVMRTVSSTTAAATSAINNHSTALMRSNTALADNVKNTQNAATGQERHNQSIISTSRGIFTMVLGFAMLNNSLVDYSLNQQSMADLQEKQAAMQERYNNAVRDYGEASFQAQQALGALQKAERAIRFENREMMNQLQNQMFLYILIAQNIASEAVPAFLNWGKTVETVRGGLGKFRTTLTGMFGSFKEFGSILTTGVVPSMNIVSGRLQQLPTDVDGVTRSIGGMNPIIMSSTGAMKNHGDIVSGLGDGYNLYGKAVDSSVEKQSRAARAADRLRGGMSRLGGVIGIGAGGGAGLLAGFAALTVGLALYSTNAGGARDLTNNFGVAVGKIHPLLRMAGDALVGVAGALGLTGENASQVNHHFTEAGEGFHDFTTAWHDALETMKNDTNTAVSIIGTALGSLSDTISNAGKLITGQPLVDTSLSRDEQIKQAEDVIRKSQQNQDAQFPLIGGLMDWFSGGKKELTQEQVTELATQLVDNYKAAATEAEERLKIDESKIKVDKMFDFGDPKNFDLIPASVIDTTTNMAGTIADYIAKLKEESALYKSLTEDVEGYTATYEDFISTRDNATVQGEILRAGQALYNAELAEETVELQKTNAYLDAYAAGLKTTDGIQREYMKGKTEMRDAFIQEQASIIQSEGAYSELYDQIFKQNGLQVTYNASLREAYLASLNRFKAISAETAALDAQHNLLAVGLTQIFAYSEGWNAQRQVLYDNAEAAEFARGSHDRLKQDMVDGLAQTVAFNKGLEETSLAIRQQTVDLEESKGAINAYIEGIQEGIVQANAYTEGIVEQREAFIQSYEAVFKSTAILNEFNLQLESGVPQGLAYAQTMLDLEMASSQADIKLAQATATLDHLRGTTESLPEPIMKVGEAMIDLNKGLEETIAKSEQSTNVLLQFSKETATAFQEGAASVRTWWEELKLAEHAEVGAYTEAAILAKEVGVTIPPAFKGGSDALMEFIAIAKRIPSALASVRDELKGIFDGMISDLAGSMREGEDELDDAIDELSESLGIKFNKGVTEALEFHAGSELFTNLSKEFGALFIGLGQNLDEKSFDGLRDGIVDKLDNVMDKVLDDIEDGPLKDKVKKSYQSIIDIFNNAELEDVQSPTAITNMIGDLGMAFIELQGNTNNFALVWDELMAAMAAGNWVEVNRLIKEANTNLENISGFTFDYLNQEFVAVQESIKLTEGAADSLAEALDNVNEKYKGLSFNDSNIRQQISDIEAEYAKHGIYDVNVSIPNQGGKIGDAESDQALQTTPIGGGGDGGGGEFTQQIKDVQAYKLELATIPTVMQQAVTGANTAAAGLVPIPAMAWKLLTDFAKALSLMSPAAAEAVNASNAEFAKLTPVHPAFAKAMVTLVTNLAKLSEGINQEVTAANVEFSYLGTTLETVALPKIYNTLAKLQSQAVVAAQGVVNIFTTESAKIVTAYDTAINDTNSGPFTNIQTFAETAAVAVYNKFKEQADKIPIAFADALKQIKLPLGQPTIENPTEITSPNMDQDASGVADIDEQRAKNKPSASGGEGVLSALSAIQTALDTLTTNFNTAMTQMMNGAFMAFTTIGEHSFIVTTKVTENYNQAALNADGVLTIMETQAAESFTMIGDSAFNVPVLVTTHYNQAALNASGVLLAMETNAATVLTRIGGFARQVAIDFTTHFNTATQNAAGTLTALMGHAANIIGNINTITQSVAVAFTTAFNRATQNAAGSLNALLNHTIQVFNEIIAAVNQIAAIFTAEFTRAAQNAAGMMNSLRQNVISNMNQIGQAAVNAANAVLTIGTAADRARSSVDALRSAVESLPNVNRTITYTIRTVGSAPAGAAQGMLPTQFMAEGGGITVGEMNTERIIRRGLRSGRVLDYLTNRMQKLTNLGLNEPEELTVIPVAGANARRWNNRFGMFMQNGGTVTPGLYGESYDHRTSTHPATGNETSGGNNGNGSTTGNVDSNGQFSQRVVTSDGRVEIQDGRITIDGEVIIDNGRPTSLQNSVGQFSESVDEFSESVNQQTRNNTTNGTAAANGSTRTRFTDERGNNYNFESDTNTTSNVGGNGSINQSQGNTNTGGTGSGTGTGNGATNTGANTTTNTATSGGVRTGTTSDSRQINYQQNINGVKKYYRVKDGKIETNMSDEEILAVDPSYPLPTSSGGGGTGGGGGTNNQGRVRDRVTEYNQTLAEVFSTALRNRIRVPTSQFRDATYGKVDNQRDPYIKEFNEFFSGDGSDGGPGNGGGGGFSFFWMRFITELIGGILGQLNSKLRIVLTNQPNGYEINRLVNHSFMDDLRRS